MFASRAYDQVLRVNDQNAQKRDAAAQQQVLINAIANFYVQVMILLRLMP